MLQDPTQKPQPSLDRIAVTGSVIDVDDTIARALQATDDLVLWYLTDLYSVARHAPLEQLLPLLSRNDHEITELLFQLFRYLGSHPRELAAGLAHLFDEEHSEYWHDEALPILARVDAQRYRDYMLRVLESDEPSDASEVALECLVASDQFSPELRERMVHYDEATAMTFLGGCMRCGAADETRAEFESFFVASPIATELEVGRLRDAFQASGVPWELINDAEDLLAADSEESIGDGFLAPGVDPRARLRSRTVLSAQQMRAWPELSKGPPDMFFEQVRRLGQQAIELAIQEEPWFAQHGKGLLAALAAMADRLAIDDAWGIEFNVLALAILAHAIRGAPPYLCDEIVTRSFSRGELRQLSRIDSPWWPTPLWQAMATELSTRHWLTLYESGDQYVRQNAQACLAVSFDIDNPPELPGAWVLPERLADVVSVGGASWVVGLIESYLGVDRGGIPQSRLVEALVYCGPSAGEILDSVGEALELAGGSWAWLVLAVHTGSRYAASQFLSNPSVMFPDPACLEAGLQLLEERQDCGEEIAIWRLRRLGTEAALRDPRQLARTRARIGGTVHNDAAKTGRNDPCSCGSGKKYKKCCM